MRLVEDINLIVICLKWFFGAGQSSNFFNLKDISRLKVMMEKITTKNRGNKRKKNGKPKHVKLVPGLFWNVYYHLVAFGKYYQNG